MAKFATRKIEIIKAREEVEELLIDNQGQLDKFEKSLKGTMFQSEFETLIRYIEHHANGNSIGKKLVILKKPSKGGMEYEHKSKHLRIYAIQEPDKKLIIFGGVKHDANSLDNIEPFRALKKRYAEQIK